MRETSVHKNSPRNTIDRNTTGSWYTSGRPKYLAWIFLNLHLLKKIVPCSLYWLVSKPILSRITPYSGTHYSRGRCEHSLDYSALRRLLREGEATVQVHRRRRPGERLEPVFLEIEENAKSASEGRRRLVARPRSRSACPTTGRGRSAP